MTIEQFLIDTYNKKLWKDIKKYNEAVADAKDLSPDAWNNKWSEYLMSNKYLVPSYKESKLEETTKALPVRLRIYFGNDKFDPSDVKRKYIQQTHFADVPKEEFERVLKQMKENYDYEVNLREQESGKKRRQMEVEGKWIRNPERNWSTLDRILSSDYEKQRYIDDPKSAIFGYEAPGFMGSSAGAKADLISGIAGGVADVATAPWPILNTFAGPSIRLGRDLVHKYDSPYQKDWNEIGTDVFKDVSLNAASSMMANTRRLSRMASKAVSTNAKSAYELSIVADDIKKGLSSLPTPSNSQEFAYAVRNLPDSPLKQDLISTFDKNGKLVDDKAAEEIIKKYSRDVKDVWQSANELVMTGQAQGKLPPHTSFMEQVLTTPKPTGFGQKLEYGLLRGVDKLNLGVPGTIAFESGYNLTGRGSKPQTVMNEERAIDFERAKNAYRANNEVNWERFGDSFKPSKIEGSPAWAAYEEWYFEKYGKYPEDK